jgi:glucose-6-phosphate 1-dehydrogenase
MYRALTEAQLKQQIDSEQTYVAWQDASTKALNFVGGMHWKQVAGKEYLYRSIDRHGRAKSLGPRSAETENILIRFNQQKLASKQRMESLTASLATHSKINVVLRLGAAPNLVADLCAHLAHEGLLKIFERVMMKAIWSTSFVERPRRLGKTSLIVLHLKVT